MHFRYVTDEDIDTLAIMNSQLIENERHRSEMTVTELENRMRKWLSNKYRAAVAEEKDKIIAYALWRRDPDWIYLRQLFVSRNNRRKGVGSAFINWLYKNAWRKGKRIRVEALIVNPEGLAFWRAIGFKDYCITLELERS